MLFYAINLFIRHRIIESNYSRLSAGKNLWNKNMRDQLASECNCKKKSFVSFFSYRFTFATDWIGSQGRQYAAPKREPDCKVCDSHNDIAHMYRCCEQ